MLFEDHSQWLLVLHAILAAASVALSTHLVFWLRPIVRGEYGNQVAVRRFAAMSAFAYLATLLLGLFLYPSYRVRVRAEYLDNPSAITRSVEARAKARESARQRNEDSRTYRMGETPRNKPDVRNQSDEVAIEAEESVATGVRYSRWFDVKEHWSALGLLMAFALLFILRSWKPEEGREGIRYVVLSLAIAVSLSTWSAAIIGLITASARSVASL